jgi:hypothetical protein
MWQMPPEASGTWPVALEGVMWQMPPEASGTWPVWRGMFPRTKGEDNHVACRLRGLAPGSC